MAHPNCPICDMFSPGAKVSRLLRGQLSGFSADYLKEQSFNVAILTVAGREDVMNGATVVLSISPKADPLHNLDDVEM